MRDINIPGKNWASTPWSGLTCEGNATLILEGSNYVQNAHGNYPAVFVPAGHTLTIKGDRELTADSGEGAAAGIGGGYMIDCGNIVISGGNIIAKGGMQEPGIGGGSWSACGNIAIEDTVAKVTAIGGKFAKHSIGAGDEKPCGTVTIGGKETGSISEKTYTCEGARALADLSKITAAYTVRYGETITGKLGANVKISIADGAVVTLRDVTINGDNNYHWAGITCEGNAVIVLEGTNYVRGFYSRYPALFVPEGRTMTIRGSGSLTAETNRGAPAIGGGDEIACGNIVIEGGSITARGGVFSSGIGSGLKASCGNITIIGGNITATNEYAGAGIGSGQSGRCGNITISGGTVNATGGGAYTGGGAGIGSGTLGSCGNITVTNKVTKVTATKGDNDTPHCIGLGSNTYFDGSTEPSCTCGTVTIGGNVGQISSYTYTYQP